MQRSNFHTHTKYSDGKNTISEMVESAIGFGFHSLGFSDHSYAVPCESYCIKREKEAEYCAEIRRLGEERKGEINLYLGLELDGDSEYPDYELDYTISSIHQIHVKDGFYYVDHSKEDFERLLEVAFNGDGVEMSKVYFNRVTEHILKNKTDIVGHFDLVTKFGKAPEDSDEYIRIALESVNEIIKHCRTFELNTGAIARGLRTVPYPAMFILNEIKRLGGRIIVTSDCHYAEKLTVWFDEAEAYLASAGFTKNEKGVLNSKIKNVEIWE